MLARLCKGTYHPTHITSLKNTRGTLSSSPKDIDEIIEAYYTNLHADKPINMDEAYKLLDSFTLPKIESEHLTLLNSPITHEESI